MGTLRYRADAICPAITNRHEDTFKPQYMEKCKKQQI